jgi:hypothetical protein
MRSGQLAIMVASLFQTGGQQVSDYPCSTGNAMLAVSISSLANLNAFINRLRL